MLLDLKKITLYISLVMTVALALAVFGFHRTNSSTPKGMITFSNGEIHVCYDYDTGSFSCSEDRLGIFIKNAVPKIKIAGNTIYLNDKRYNATENPGESKEDTKHMIHFSTNDREIPREFDLNLYASGPFMQASFHSPQKRHTPGLINNPPYHARGSRSSDMYLGRKK